MTERLTAIEERQVREWTSNQTTMHTDTVERIWATLDAERAELAEVESLCDTYEDTTQRLEARCTTLEADVRDYEEDCACLPEDRSVTETVTALAKERDKLKAFGQEFIWCEENPDEYESEMSALTARCSRLEAAIRTACGFADDDDRQQGVSLERSLVTLAEAWRNQGERFRQAHCESLDEIARLTMTLRAIKNHGRIYAEGQNHWRDMAHDALNFTALGGAK